MPTLERHQGADQPLHRHPDARLVVILAGGLDETSLGGRHRLGPGDMVFRPPYQLHADRIGGGPARYLRFAISPAAWRQVRERSGWRAGRGRIALDDERLAARDPAAGDRLLGACLPVEMSAPITEDWLADLARRLTRLDARSLRLDRYARERGLLPCRLSRAFSARYGLSPGAFRREARLQRALEMLAVAEWSLSRIAADCGYADQSHLTREVTRATGAPPGQLRRSLAAG